ncbi:MAG: hypothetical protein WC787_00805 [Patescibacteria group bacterium]|jgi:hypothetical protein
MKRVLFVILGVFLTVAVFALWWVFRDTPASVLRGGFERLAVAKTASVVTADIAWTDTKLRTTTGFGVAGSLDVTNPTESRFLGVLRLGEGLAGSEQTADLIVERDRFLLRPREVSASSRARYMDLVGDPEEDQFAMIARDAFLNHEGYSSVIGKGSMEDVRAALPVLMDAVVVTGPWEEEENGDTIVTVPFALDQRALAVFLNVFIKAWNGRDPTAQDFLWINQTTSELARGQFWMTVDRRTNAPIVLRGEWPDLDTNGAEQKRIRVRIDLQGLNAPVTIGVPDDAKDITSSLVPVRTGGSLQGSGLRPLSDLPSLPAATSTGAPNRDNSELFHQYLEELDHRNKEYD